MNVSLKKLLSMLIVMAMVVSMIVPVNFSFAKAETTTPATSSVIPAAAQAEIAKGKLVKERSAAVKDAFLNATGEVTAVCPVCGEEKVWKPIKGDHTLKDGTIAFLLGDASGEFGGHVYFAEDFIRDYDMARDGLFARSGCINLNGKTVTLNGAKLIELYSSRTINILDTAGNAVVTGSNDKSATEGKTLGLQGTAVLNLYGGTFQAMNDTYNATNAKTDHADGSAVVSIRGGTLNMYEGATIVGVDGNTGNTAKWGGAVNVGANAVFNMYGGTIRDGKGINGGNVCLYNSGAKMNMYGGEILDGTYSSGSGGNVYLNTGTTFNQYGGSISGGNARYGGNVYTQRTDDTTFGTFKMYGGSITDGVSTYTGKDTGGGNIANKGALEIYGGEILNGTAANASGGNIACYNSATIKPVVTISGGFIAGGTAYSVDYGHNIFLGGYTSSSKYYCTTSLTMSGGTVVGYLAAFNATTSAFGSTAKYTPAFSGTARLVPYGVDSQGNAYSATTTLTKVTFSSASITTGGMLFGGALDKAYGYCQDCGKASVAYTVVTKETKMTAGGHYIFLGSPLDYTFATPDSGSSLLQTSAAGKVCIDLNGADIKVHKGRFLYLGWGGTVNIRDSAGGAVVSGSYDWFGTNGATIQTGDLQSSDLVVNVYGGTYKKFQYEGDPANGSTHNPNAIVRVRQRCTFNLYEGAVIDGRDLNQAAPAAVFIGNNAGYPSTFNLKGGTVYGGTNTNGDGDAFRVGNSANTATLNIESGLVVGAGDKAIQVRNGATLNISGGTISGEGDSVASYLTNTVSISGGTMGTVDVTEGSTLTLSGKPVIGMLHTNGVLANVDGLSSEADITVSAGAGTILTAATNNDIGNAIKHADPENLLIKKNADGQYYVDKNFDEPVAGVFDPEACGGKAYCPICGGEAVEWTSLQGDIDGFAMEAGKHYYLSDNTNVSGSITGSGCLNLNGFELKEAGSSKLIDAQAEQVITVMDTKDADATGTGTTGKVIGKFAYNGQGGAAGVDGGTLNIYGGTYINNHTGGSTVGIRGANGGTINIHGGIIDGRIYDENGQLTDTQKTIIGAALVLNTSNVSGTVNMYDGLIIGGATSSRGGAVYLANAKATFNMYGGEIVAGQASNGNAISNNGANQVYVNLYGGKISLPEGAALTGHSINMIGNVRVVFGGVHPITEEALSPVVEGAVYIAGTSPVVTLNNQTQIDSLELNGNKATITDLAAGAKIGIVTDYDVPFTTAYTGSVDMNTVFTTTLENAVLKQNDEGQFYYKEKILPQPGKFNPWECEGEAYCPICGTVEEWTAVTEPTKMEGGHYYLASNINKDYANDSDNSFITGAGCLNLNGKTVTINAGRFLSVGAGTTEVFDTEGGAMITGSANRYDNNGATIKVDGTDAILNLRAGTYKATDDTVSGTDTDTTGSLLRVRTGTLNLYEGAVIDGAGYEKVGNYSLVYIGHTSGDQAFNMYGGDIMNGTSAQYGGNVYIRQGKTFTMSGGAILNGKAMQGGNVFVASTATTGGTFHMEGGFIGGGTATSGNTQYGGNVGLQTYKNSDGTYINNCTFSMTGGTIAGDVCVNWGSNLANKSYNISGTARIVPEALYEGVTYTGTSGAVRISFNLDGAEKGFEVWTGQVLGNTYVWCDHCDDIIKWTNIYADSDPVAAAAGHIRFLEDVAYTYATQDGYSAFLKASGSAYIDLQGHDVTIEKGRFLTVDGSNWTVDVVDSVGGAEVSGSYDFWSGNARTIQVNGTGTTLNLRGGTYTGFVYEGATANATAVLRLRDSATVNLYEGAVIDGSDLSQKVATIFVGNAAGKPSTFNVEGGTVIGGENTNGDGGAFRIGNGVNTAVLNVNSGMIVGGKTTIGDAIQVREGNTATINGGLIVGGEGSADSLIWNYGTLNIGGGVIVGEIRVEAGSTQTTTPVTVLSGAPVITKEYVVGETTYTGTAGLRMCGGLLADVNGLTDGASVYVNIALNVPFTTAYTGSVDMSKVFAFKDTVLLAQNEDMQFMVIVPTVIVDGVAYGSVEDALKNYDVKDGKTIIFMESQVTISKDILVDIAASAENLVISGSGTVYGFDTSNDDYEGYIKITVSGDVKVAPEASANGKRYMALKEGNSYGFHRFETKLTHVTLRTTEAGLYYKASYVCDAVVRDRVVAHGVVLSVVDMPGANFLVDKGNLYTAIDGKFAGLYNAENHTVNTTSGSVFGILKTDRDPALNTQYLDIDVYANSYFLVDMDGDGDTHFYMADTVNGGKKRSDEGFTGVAKNLLEVVTAINEPAILNGLNATVKKNLVDFANGWLAYLDNAGKARWAAATNNITA